MSQSSSRLGLTRERLITFVLLLVASALFVYFAPPANAHAIVSKTEPGIDQVVDESPERVVMYFNEAVEIAFGAVRVYDTNAERVDTGEADHLNGEPETVAVQLKPNLPDGTYTVTWQVVSADSHPISEAFVFHVGKPGSKPQGIASELLGGSGGNAEEVLFGFVRWASFAAMLLLAGAFAFAVAVWLGWPRAALARPAEIERSFGVRWRRLILWSWAATIVTTLLSIVLQGAVAADLSIAEAIKPTIIEEVLGTRYGRVALMRLAVLGVGAILWVVARRSSVAVFSSRRLATSSAGAAGASTIPSWVVYVGLAVVFALLMTPGLQGHAGTAEPVPLNVLTDGIHLLAAAAWLGGLFLLWTAAGPATKSLGDPDRVSVMAPVVARFSDLALVSVAVIVATGTYRAFVEIGSFNGLFNTSYGTVFLWKLGAFLPLLALGVVNNRWTKPRITKAAAEHTSGGALTSLWKLVGAETALVAVVLAITAALVTLPPASVSAGTAGPFVTDTHLGHENLQVLVDPNKVGDNEVHLTVTSMQGAPVAIKAMRVEFTMPSEEIGPIVGEGTKLAKGHFVVQGHQLSVPGEWSLAIVARVGRFTEERATVTVMVNQ